MVRVHRFSVVLAIAVLTGVSVPTAASAASSPPGAACAPDRSVPNCSGLTQAQRRSLQAIARDTWPFFDADTDSPTHLPMDNIGFMGAPAKGHYTSPTNVAMYFWGVVAARDLHFIDQKGALTRANATLTAVEKLEKWHGFLYSWYSTQTGHRINGPLNPTDAGFRDQQGSPPKGEFLSAVDNGWYGAGLILVRQAFPELAARATALLNETNSAQGTQGTHGFGIFYDNGPQDPMPNQSPAGQQYGGYIAEVGPATFHYGILNTETRIGAYMGMGTHTMPGDVWWRTWRTLPRSFDWQGQPPQPVPPKLVTYRDPQSGKAFTVDEAHYNWPVATGIPYVPSWGGSQFEALMDPLAIPEDAWGPRSFGLNDLRYAQAQIKYATEFLGYPVWGLSPSSTPDDTGNYDAYGASRMASNANCCPYDQWAVTPHATFIALPFVPQDALANIQKMRSLYPTIYGPYGFYDAVNPTTGQVGHRYLVLDEGMLFAGLFKALDHAGLQKYYARDPVIKVAQPYLSMETFSIQ
jgi:Putative glucoamylase